MARLARKASEATSPFESCAKRSRRSRLVASPVYISTVQSLLRTAASLLSRKGYNRARNFGSRESSIR